MTGVGGSAVSGSGGLISTAAGVVPLDSSEGEDGVTMGSDSGGGGLEGSDWMGRLEGREVASECPDKDEEGTTSEPKTSSNSFLSSLTMALLEDSNGWRSDEHFASFNMLHLLEFLRHDKKNAHLGFLRRLSC